VTMEAHCPALAFDSEKSFAVTFASETGSSARAYLETPLPQGDFVESILALRHSPLIENNPDYKLPQSYEGLCSLIEKAQGQIVCKSLYSEKQWTSYVYDDGKYLGNVLFELPEEAESALDIIALAKTVSLKDLSSQTLLELLAAVLDQGDLDTTAAAAKLMKAFLYHTDFFGSKDETGMQFRAEVHDDFSADLLDYLSKYNLGEVSFLSAGLEANFERKADEYRLKDLTFSASANLFGELNKVEADFVSTKHETKDSLYLDEIQRQLEADAHQ